MVALLVLIEGGGSTRAEQADLRQGFERLFGKVLGAKRKPKILCAGGRGQAFEDFRNAIADRDTVCLLLVDSEGPVNLRNGASPWDHVATRVGDQWRRPQGATDDQLHFMVEAMEAWLVADPEALAAYYGDRFKRTKLPRRLNLEQHPKADLMTALEAATKDAKPKGKYRKAHGFELIGRADPDKIRIACPTFAVRFFDELQKSEPFTD